MIYQPYTYLIGWSKHSLWYYGVQYGEISTTANPVNLWRTYFTSSKIVKQCRKILGEPDIIEVRKVFNTADAAIKWETKVLRRLNASLREDFLNLQNGSGETVCKHDDYMREIKSQRNRDFWARPENKGKRSLEKKEWFKKNGTESIRRGLVRRYSDSDYMEKFQKTMSEVNKRYDKRYKASQKLKDKWKDPHFRERRNKSLTGNLWWTDGTNTIKCRESPGSDWVRGRSNSNLGRKKNETNKNNN